MVMYLINKKNLNKILDRAPRKQQNGAEKTFILLQGKWKIIKQKQFGFYQIPHDLMSNESNIYFQQPIKIHNAYDN